jgi:hypothetical protein
VLESGAYSLGGSHECAPNKDQSQRQEFLSIHGMVYSTVIFSNFGINFPYGTEVVKNRLSGEQTFYFQSNIHNGFIRHYYDNQT